MKVHGFNPSEQEITVMIENVDKGRVQNTKKSNYKTFYGRGRTGVNYHIFYFEPFPKNKNKSIDFEEFVSMMVNITESSVDQGYNVSEAFQVFDKVKLC